MNLIPVRRKSWLETGVGILLIVLLYSCSKSKDTPPVEEPRFFSPTGLKTIVANDSTLRISWKDNSNVETGFQVQRKAGNEILRKTISAGRALAELNGTLLNLPNPTLFIDTIYLQEAKASSEVENIITTNDELYKSMATDRKAENFSDQRSFKLQRGSLVRTGRTENKALHHRQPLHKDCAMH